MLFIGMDLGTSAGKLLSMNENGEVYKTVSKQYAVSFPQKRVGRAKSRNLVSEYNRRFKGTDGKSGERQNCRDWIKRATCTDLYCWIKRGK